MTMPDPVLIHRKFSGIDLARILKDQIIVVVETFGDIRDEAHRFRFVFLDAERIRRAEKNDDATRFRSEMASPDECVSRPNDGLRPELGESEILADQLNVIPIEFDEDRFFGA